MYCPFFFFLRATSAACRSPQPRGLIGTAAMGYTTATAVRDPSNICDLHWSLQQHRILNPLSEAKDRNGILMDTSWVLNLLNHNRNSFCFLDSTRVKSYSYLSFSVLFSNIYWKKKKKIRALYTAYQLYF